MINEFWAESSSSAEGQQISKVLWGLKIPSKLKYLGGELAMKFCRLE